MGRGSKAIGAFTAAAAFAAASAFAETPSPEREETRFRSLLLSLGEREFALHCAVCHGADARGKGPAAEALKTAPTDLTRIAERRGGTFPDAEIAQEIDGRREVLAHGSRQMPVWGNFLGTAVAEDASGGEVAHGRVDLLVEYLKSIQSGAAGSKP